MKIGPVGSRVVPCERHIHRRPDGQKDMPKLKDAFRNFANAPN